MGVKDIHRSPICVVRQCAQDVYKERFVNDKMFASSTFLRNSANWFKGLRVVGRYGRKVYVVDLFAKFGQMVLRSTCRGALRPKGLRRRPFLRSSANWSKGLRVAGRYCRKFRSLSSSLRILYFRFRALRCAQLYGRTASLLAFFTIFG